MTGFSQESLVLLHEGNAHAFVYVEFRQNAFFQYSDQEPRPIVPGLYRVADTDILLEALTEFRKSGSVEGIKPGELLDGEGKRFFVIRPGLPLFEDDPDPEAVGFGMDSFIIKTKEKRDSEVTAFLRLFRADCPEGGLAQFAVWADGHEDVELIFDAGATDWTRVQWNFPGSKEPKRWARSSIKNKV